MFFYVKETNILAKLSLKIIISQLKQAYHGSAYLTYQADRIHTQSFNEEYRISRIHVYIIAITKRN